MEELYPMDYDCQAPTITYSAPLAFNDNSHSSQSWLWAIMLLSQAVKFCHSLLGRARHPICHVSPASFRVMQRANVNRPLAAVIAGRRHEPDCTCQCWHDDMNANAHTPPDAEALGGVECGRRPRLAWSAE